MNCRYRLQFCAVMIVPGAMVLSAAAASAARAIVDEGEECHQERNSATGHALEEGPLRESKIDHRTGR